MEKVVIEKTFGAVSGSLNQIIITCKDGSRRIIKTTEPVVRSEAEITAKHLEGNNFKSLEIISSKKK